MGVCLSLEAETQTQPIAVERPPLEVHESPKKVNLENLDPNLVESVPLKGQIIDAKLVDVHDGDTVKVIVLYGEVPFKISIRILGVDTPEITKGHGRLPEEHEAAVKARDYLRKILSTPLIKVKFHDWDKFGGRVLGEVFTSGGESVTSILIEGGWAREYNGEKKREWTLSELTSGPFAP